MRKKMYPAKAKVMTNETVSSVPILMGGGGGELGAGGGAWAPGLNCGNAGGVGGWLGGAG
jgi:hypothetical protein